MRETAVKEEGREKEERRALVRLVFSAWLEPEGNLDGNG